MLETAKKIHHHIKAAKKVVLVPHQNPDCDALGSATALYEYLQQIAKPTVMFCATPAAKGLHFLPHTEMITFDPIIFSDKEVDTVIVLDSGDLGYAGVKEHLEGHLAKIINIDHHATNQDYGHINLVKTDASSTAEIIYHFFIHNGIILNAKMATSLLSGLITDTGNFTNAATTASALQTASQLVRAGANLNLINKGTQKNKSVGALRLWGNVLGRLKYNDRLALTHTYVTLADIKEHGVDESESEGISNFLNNLDDTKIALVLKELPGGKVKGSLRTTKDNVDVTKIAKRFNGGGHKKAAGFTASGSIAEVLEKILTN